MQATPGADDTVIPRDVSTELGDGMTSGASCVCLEGDLSAEVSFGQAGTIAMPNSASSNSKIAWIVTWHRSVNTNTNEDESVYVEVGL